MGKQEWSKERVWDLQSELDWWRYGNGMFCCPAKFAFTALTKVSCPSGMSPIFSEATCKTAMKSLTGKSVASVGKHCWHKHPQGCFTHYPRNKSTRILMNNKGCGLKSGTTYHDTSAICGK